MHFVLLFIETPCFAMVYESSSSTAITSLHFPVTLSQPFLYAYEYTEMSLSCKNKLQHFQILSKNNLTRNDKKFDRSTAKDCVVDLSNHSHSENKCIRYEVNESHIAAEAAGTTRKNILTLLLPWISYVGDCKAFHSYLQSKSGVGWLILKYLDALLRGISQVVFSNNPITGLIILLALFFSSVFIGIAAIFTGSLAIITAIVIGHDTSSIQSGLTTYNAVLVGSVTASLWTPLYEEPLSFKIWIFIGIGAILSVFITSAISSILSSFKIPLPALTLPFNIVNLLLFTCLKPCLSGLNEIDNTTQGPALFKVHNTTSSDLETIDNGIDKELELDFAKVFFGIIISMGQVYGIESVLGSILMYIGIMIYSPLLCVMSFVGATIGTLFGIIFDTTKLYSAIYRGIWGYNGILSTSSIAGFFIVFNIYSFGSAIANAILTVLIQQVLVLAFQNLHLPFFTLPFVLSTLIFLSVSTSGDQLPRVGNISFPEMHLYEYRQKTKVNWYKESESSESKTTDKKEENGGTGIIFNTKYIEDGSNEVKTAETK